MSENKALNGPWKQDEGTFGKDFKIVDASQRTVARIPWIRGDLGPVVAAAPKTLAKRSLELLRGNECDSLGAWKCLAIDLESEATMKARENLNKIAYSALKKLAAHIISESPAFVAAGLKNPLWNDGRRIERRFRLVGVLDSLVDSMHTAQVHAMARANLEAFAWNGTQARTEARVAWQSLLSRTHNLPE